MLDLSKSYSKIHDKSIEGVWVPIGDDGELKIALFDGKRFPDIARRLRKVQNLNNKTISTVKEEELEELTLDFLSACIVDWKNIGDKGQPIEFSFFNVRKVLSIYDELRIYVAEFVADKTNFIEYEEVVEETKKNVQTS